MVRRLFWLALAACGGSRGGGPHAPHGEAIRLEPVASETWYRATTTCGQGPYEIAIDATGARWGEEVELLVHTPHAIALRAELIADGAQVAQQGFGDRPDNARCIADAHERLAHVSTNAPPGDATPGRLVVPPPAAAPPTQPAQLEIVPEPVTTSEQVLRFRLPERATPHLRIRVWSVAPNDLEGVLFGAAHIEWRPNVPDARYEAYLVERAEAERQESARAAAEWERTHPPHVATSAELDRARREEQRRIADEAERARRAAEEERRAQIAAALETERRARHAAYCAAHADSRDCWGAGGLRVHLDLETHRREAAAFCAAHQEDARCWSDADRARRETVWQARLDAARAPACQPDGAPPAALADAQPPKLSAHAEWRPGYWQWTECTWVWLAGMWRVPDSDIAAETTTIAPAAPPALQVEVAPPSPIRTAVWVPGFWQWSGSGWVWIAGSWQLRPSTSVTWRPAQWHPRGSVHVLIPGGWIDVR